MTEVLGELGRPNTLFVLCVDDFDLNPIHAVPLVQLLRHLRLPWLAVLVAADLGSLRPVLETAYVNRIVAVGGVSGSAPESVYNGLRPTVKDLVGEGLRKFFPRGQRGDLCLPSWTEVEGFRVVGDPAPDSRERLVESGKARQGPSLKELLGRFQWPRERPPNNPDKTFYDWLHFGAPPDDGSDADFPDYLYVGAGSFRLPLRDLVDLSLEIERLSESSVGGLDWSPLVPVAGRLREDSRPPDIPRGDSSGGLESAPVPRSKPGRIIRPTEKGGRTWSPPARQSVELASFSHWGSVGDSPGDAPACPAREVATRLLYHDLSWLQSPDFRRPPFDLGNSFAVTWWGLLKGSTFKVPWAMPHWRTAWDQEHFLRQWTEFLADQRRSGNEELVEKAYVWLNSATDFLDGHEKERLKSTRKSWKLLLQRVARLWDNERPWVKVWPVQVVAMLCLEGGVSQWTPDLPADVVAAFGQGPFQDPQFQWWVRLLRGESMQGVPPEDRIHFGFWTASQQEIFNRLNELVDLLVKLRLNNQGLVKKFCGEYKDQPPTGYQFEGIYEAIEEELTEKAKDLVLSEQINEATGSVQLEQDMDLRLQLDLAEEKLKNLRNALSGWEREYPALQDPLNYWGLGKLLPTEDHVAQAGMRTLRDRLGL
ncbi:MAG: hypothetical protein AB1758_01240 [Candidatus Eremiobacterota bacterium]